jgi:hypothetical protein
MTSPNAVPERRPKRQAKSTAISTALRDAPTGALVQMPHGGALRNGGTNKGGTGRPPTAIREAFAVALDERLQVLQAIADNPEVAPGDRIRAVDVIGKYSGVVTSVPELEGGGALLRPIQVVLAHQVQVNNHAPERP